MDNTNYYINKGMGMETVSIPANVTINESRKTHVTEALDLLELNTKTLHSHLLQLRERLGPVLRPQPQGDPEAKPGLPDHVMLARRIYESITNISRLDEEVEQMLKLLEL